MENSDSTLTQSIKNTLDKLPGLTSVGDISIVDRKIENLILEKESIGILSIRRLKVADAAALYAFYFQGLSPRSRDFFPPYPLFSPPISSWEELAERIREWQKEDDWTALILIKDKNIIGMGLLKRYNTERPVSGLAVSEQFQEKGLGSLIQTIINEQARLLRLRALYATAAPDNAASLKVHEGCGFRRTGQLKPHYVYRNGEREIDRQDVELVLKIQND